MIKLQNQPALAQDPLQHYWAVLRRRRWLVVSVALLAAVVACGASLTQANRFQATSTVLVNRQSLANQLSGTADIGLQQQSFQQILVTQSRLARTPTVLRSALKSTRDGATYDEFKSDSSVDANADSDLLSFRVTDGDMSAAKRLSLAYANAYVEYRRSLDGAALTRAMADVDRAIRDARAERPVSRALINGLATSRRDLQTRLVLQSANAQVVAAPEEAVKVQPRPVRNAFFGLVVGLLLGLGAALTRDAFDTRLRSSEEAEAALGLPILSRIRRPRGRGGLGADAADLTMRGSPSGPEAEGFRILRANLSFGLLAHHAKTVMVTSAIQGEGKSTTVANLAIAIALTGKRVALVELDFRRPSLGRLFDLNDSRGLTTVAIGESDLGSAINRVELPRLSGSLGSTGTGALSVLTSGPLPPDPAEFLGTDGVRQLVENLAGEYDYVLLDSPPIVTVSDATLIADLADAAFVCVRIGVVTRPLLHEMHRALDRLPLPVLGLAITGADADDAVGYGQYGYGVNNYVAAGSPTGGKSPA